MDNRGANFNPHPPNCTCVDCVNKRLGIITHQKHNSYHPSNKQRQPSYKRNVRNGTPKQQHPHGIPKSLKILGKLGLNLLVLTTLGLLIWSSIKAFSHQWTPAIGGTVVIATLTLFILMSTQLSKWKYRKPSMKLTVFGLTMLFLVAAFSGVEPIASYKDMVLNKVSTTIQSTNSVPQPPTTIPNQITTPIIPATPTPNITPLSPTVPMTTAANNDINNIQNTERLSFDLINSERVKTGLPATLWDDKLYQLSKAHTQEMANQRQLFHSPMNGLIGEDAWGGYGYTQYSGKELAQVIVNSWMSSPLHKAWILHAPLQHSVVSIISDSNGQYASWTFWTAEAGEGPPLIQRAYNLWQSETGGNIPWLTWLYDVKDYPDNQDFLKQLGIK